MQPEGELWESWEFLWVAVDLQVELSVCSGGEDRGTFEREASRPTRKYTLNFPPGSVWGGTHT